MSDQSRNQTKPSARAGALSGIRVLDLSRVLAGPLCGQLLADLGADVIKVERPGRGDDSRAWGPPYVMDRDGKPTQESAFYWACNRGKRSVVADLSSAAGRQVVARLAAQSDVLIENFKSGTLQRYGLGFEQLSSTNPGLVYCSITGFGQTGPYRERPGYDTIIQALGGLMSITGRQDDAPGAGPLKAGLAVTDLMTALYSTVAILAALNERATSGLGQYVDMSLLDVQVAALGNVAMNFLVSGDVPKRIGNRLPTVYPSDAFRCSDGDVMLIVGNDEQFRRFCAAAGLDQALVDMRFATNSLRVRNADALAASIAPVLARRSVQEWVAKFEAAGIPCSPINDIAQVFADPQVVAREMVRPLEHPGAGPVPTIANPIRLSRTPLGHSRPPPTLGQHTGEVLAEVLGLTADEISRLNPEKT
jgi:crotonobetainyl-CoA:carnitine CoA-transferase CaiB-like acyl-CoA transferase